MAIKNIVTETAGLSAVLPQIIYIDTDDTIATVTTAGYLDSNTYQGLNLSEAKIALVTTKTSPNSPNTTTKFYNLSYSGGVWTLVAY
jgi:hypothetical protein